MRMFVKARLLVLISIFALATSLSVRRRSFTETYTNVVSSTWNEAVFSKPEKRVAILSRSNLVGVGVGSLCPVAVQSARETEAVSRETGPVGVWVEICPGGCVAWLFFCSECLSRVVKSFGELARVG